MTEIEERAFEKYPVWMVSKSDGGVITSEYDVNEVKRVICIDAARLQRAIDIAKACEWMEVYMESLGYIDEWCRNGEAGFRKAMEE